MSSCLNFIKSSGNFIYSFSTSYFEGLDIKNKMLAKKFPKKKNWQFDNIIYADFIKYSDSPDPLPNQPIRMISNCHFCIYTTPLSNRSNNRYINQLKKFFCPNFCISTKSVLTLHRVFHGIRFKVRGLVVERQLIFFYLPTTPQSQIIHTEIKSPSLGGLCG